PDTQTGLRAFRKEELPFMAEVDGERYEYEMKVLIACSRARIPMIPITIETIYENANEGTHFHPIRDSFRIYKVILGSFFKFMASSLTCWAIDQGLFNLINKVILNNSDDSSKPVIFISKAIARVVSGIINFALNRKYVFGDKDKSGKPFIRYVILWSAILLLSGAFTTLFSLLGINSTITSIIVDMLLYFVSYRLQERWVFKEEQPDE
ncbi:MAG: GtrA family protein, partial [Eubacteriales bacterium]